MFAYHLYESNDSLKTFQRPQVQLIAVSGYLLPTIAKIKGMAAVRKLQWDILLNH